MPSQFKLSALMGAALIMTTAPHARAEEDNSLFLSLEAGAEYDDNITVSAADLTTQKGDGSALIDGLIEYDFINDGNSSLKVGYSFSQSLHSNLTEFDLQIQGASVTTSTNINDVEMALSYRYNNIRLGNKAFLEMHSVQPTFTTLVGSKLLVVGGYEFLKQNFKQPLLLKRNANRHSGNLKLYFLLGKGRTVNIGYKYSNQNAVAAELDYIAHRFDVGFKLPIAGLEGTKFSGRYRYQKKNYSNLDPVIGAKRSDKSNGLRASLAFPVFLDLTARLQYEYTDFKSNLPGLSYKNNLISFNLGWEL